MACPGNETRDSCTTQTDNNGSAEEEVSLKKSASNTLAVMYQKNGAGTNNYRSLMNMMICFHRQAIRPIQITKYTNLIPGYSDRKKSTGGDH